MLLLNNIDENAICKLKSYANEDIAVPTLTGHRDYFIKSSLPLGSKEINNRFMV